MINVDIMGTDKVLLPTDATLKQGKDKLLY